MQSRVADLFPGGGHPPPDQGEQLGAGLEGRPDLGRGRQQQRPARHLPEGTGRMERRVTTGHKLYCASLTTVDKSN